MIMRIIYLLLLFVTKSKFVILEETQDNEITDTKLAKFLSIFTIIRFRPFPCNGSGDNNQGTCVTTIQCERDKGIAIGSCAQGWGVCCQVTKSACGSTVDKNSTYIQNPKYPDNENGSQFCCYKINKCNNNICWLRLDMIRNTLAAPSRSLTAADNGDCKIDRMTTTCSAGTRMPDNFCGVNDAQHVYLDVCTVSDCSICFNLGSEAANERIWRIRVSQIECDNDCAPPGGCLQYYKGSSGTFCSLGFVDSQDSIHLSVMEYSICVRMEKNKCSITYSASTSVANPFRISRPALPRDPADASEVGGPCANDYILIPVGSSPSGTVAQNLFCGTKLAAASNIETNEPVTSTGKPFVVQYVTNLRERSVDQNGFCLDYVQNDC